jgi:hypothetical protein
VKNIVLQRIRKEEENVYSLAERYYMVLSAVNGLKLTEREIQLIAFTAIRGNISYASIREEFCKKHNTTNASINNIISKLKRTGIMVKDGTRVKVNPQIVMNFENDIVLEIRVLHK